ncbi:phosphatase PAP2 family protein [Rhodoferax sp.]|uniref:phosphatase PAP2 family protein n=1 Tax=Rhodoferax sp. TaxID=50421 RepID=UPI003267B795
MVGDFLIYLVPVILAWIWLTGGFRQRNLALKTFAVVMLAVGVNQLIALVWQHARPFVLGLGHAWIEHQPDSSFPSDHVTVLSGVGLTLLLGGAAGLAGFMLVCTVLVAWARVFLGVHFPLDMLGAVCVSGVTLALVTPLWHRFGALLTNASETLYRRVFAWPISNGWMPR